MKRVEILMDFNPFFFSEKMPWEYIVLTITKEKNILVLYC